MDQLFEKKTQQQIDHLFHYVITGKCQHVYDNHNYNRQAYLSICKNYKHQLCKIMRTI